MKLWMTSETESSVADDLRLVRNSVEDDLGSYLFDKNYDLELGSLDCIIILRNDDVFEEITRYSPKKRDMDFRLSINFDTFVSSDFGKRKTLVLETIIRAIDILATKKSINKEAIQNLRGDVISFGESHDLLPI